MSHVSPVDRSKGGFVDERLEDAFWDNALGYECACACISVCSEITRWLPAPRVRPPCGYIGGIIMATIPEAVSNNISSKQRVGLKFYSCGQTALNRLPTQLPGVHSKPNCSYNCLIGMALKGSKRKCLPVNEIYTFFL